MWVREDEIVKKWKARNENEEKWEISKSSWTFQWVSTIAVLLKTLFSLSCSSSAIISIFSKSLNFFYHSLSHTKNLVSLRKIQRNWICFFFIIWEYGWYSYKCDWIERKSNFFPFVSNVPALNKKTKNKTNWPGDLLWMNEKFAGRKRLTWCARSASALRDSASRSCKLNESNMASDIHSASFDIVCKEAKHSEAWWNATDE